MRIGKRCFKIIRKIALFGLIGLFALGAARRPRTTDRRPPDDRPHPPRRPRDRADRLDVAADHPRRHQPPGVRAGQRGPGPQGQAGPRSLSVEPVGDEVRSVLPGRGRFRSAAAANEDLAADLPVSVDNSLLRFFPPIRSQGSLGSCVSFAITYYQLSYMTAFQRNLDIRDTATIPTSTRRNGPTTWSTAGATAARASIRPTTCSRSNGAATWAGVPLRHELPRLVPRPGRSGGTPSASGRRSSNTSMSASTATGLELIKELLTDGYIVVYGTYISSWVFKNASRRPLDVRRRRRRGAGRRLLAQRQQRRARDDHRRLQRRRLDGHQRGRHRRRGRKGRLPHRQFLGHRVARGRLHVAGL